VNTFDAAPVSVYVPVVNVFPFTVVGVIAPRASEIAGVVVGEATDPLTPFAGVTLTDVTVPDPPPEVPPLMNCARAAVAARIRNVTMINFFMGYGLVA
jgi:hypothetical protein